MYKYERANRILREAEISFIIDGLQINIDFITVDRFKPGDGYEAHLHSKYEFHYIKSGRGYVDMEGRRFFLFPKSFYICSPGVIHRQIADIDDPMVEYALKCDLSPAENGGPLSHEYRLLLSVLDNSSLVITDNCEMDHMFEEIFDEAEQAKAGFLLQIKSGVVRLLTSSLRNLSSRENAEYSIPQKDDNRRFELIREYINDNIGKCITCSEISNQLFLSEKQLNRVVRKVTGLSTHRFIMQCKLSRVKKLMEDPKTTFYDIASQTGFSSAFHLSARFKQYTGMSPSQYRNRNNRDDSIFIFKRQV